MRPAFERGGYHLQHYTPSDIENSSMRIITQELADAGIVIPEQILIEFVGLGSPSQANDGILHQLSEGQGRPGQGRAKGRAADRRLTEALKCTFSGVSP